MTVALSHDERSLFHRLMPSRQRLPLWMTFIVVLLLYTAASFRFTGFFSLQVFVNLLGDNAFLGIAAVGMTFVIIAGGIDLSVGTAIGCTSIFIASMVQNYNWHPAVAIAAVLIGGTVVGCIQGSLIHFFKLQPFLVTLGGLFFYRGLGLLISRESIAISHPAYDAMSGFAIPLGESAAMPFVAIVFLVVLLIAAYIAAYRPIGRAVYALGGNEQSALLMGLPVGRIKIGVYACSGFCAALAGVVSTVYMSSGNALTATGLELDAISAVVIGGTLLSGGVGGPIGTLLGVLIFGIIQTAITFQGTLSAWWARIVMGLLLLTFILLQTLLQPRENHS
jgi:ribose/xylose/arabinose/galactoside ABC-type transport system permease subunit